MVSNSDFVKNFIGYWGPVTSTLDWCEGNYDTCYFIAEFYNSLTNFTIIFLSLFGIYQCRQIKLGPRYEIAFGCLCLVGLGSLLFHSTLQYWMQMLDELPMIYTTLYLTFLIFEIDVIDTKHSRIESSRSGLLKAVQDVSKLFWPNYARYPYLPALLFIIGLSFSLVYTGFHINPLFHQVAYAACVFLLLFRSIHLVQRKVENPRQKQELLNILVPGVIIFALGFAVWNLDNILCHQLAQLRSKLPTPLDGILQLHGWWHILTAIGAYSYIVFCSYLRVVLIKSPTVKLSFSIFGTVPYLSSKSTAKAA